MEKVIQISKICEEVCKNKLEKVGEVERLEKVGEVERLEVVGELVKMYFGEGGYGVFRKVWDREKCGEDSNDCEI